MNPASPSPSPKKKISPLVWILVAVACLFVVFGLAIVAAGFFVVHKVKQAGLDPDLMRSNPALAMTKFIAATNPDVDLVSIDERKGVATLREKKTGKTVTFNFEDIKNGRLEFTDEQNKKVTVNTSKDGAIEVKSDQGVARIGAGGKAPDWIPSFPGAKAETTTYSSSGQEGEAGVFAFTAGDPPDKAVRFYEEALKKSGFEVNTNLVSADGKTTGGLVRATHQQSGREVMVTVGANDSGSAVSVTYSVKKSAQ